MTDASYDTSYPFVTLKSHRGIYPATATVTTFEIEIDRGNDRQGAPLKFKRLAIKLVGQPLKRLLSHSERCLFHETDAVILFLRTLWLLL